MGETLMLSEFANLYWFRKDWFDRPDRQLRRVNHALEELAVSSDLRERFVTGHCAI